MDTGVLIDHLRGTESATSFLTDAISAGRVLASSALCRLEVVAGMRRGEERRTLSLLSILLWVPVDEPTLLRAEDLARLHGPANRGIGAVDYVVAATTELVDGDLATTNPRHFPMIPGLRPPYPYS